MEYTVKIIVATHKKYRMPADTMYIPLHVGADLAMINGSHEEVPYCKDNTGDNISQHNAKFCELTGLYWAWKNLDADYIGLVHYRRHFCIKKSKKDLFDNVLTYKQLIPFLGGIKIFIPNKRKYIIETLYSHYQHTHYSEQLDEVKKIIEEKYPDYRKSYDKIVNQTYGYMFNMMIVEKELLHKYCEWLFSILFELKNRVDDRDLSAYQGRFYGRISEIIFNVWLDYQVISGNLSKSEIKEIPCIHMEKVNWVKKGMAFLKAKFLGVRYEGSF